MKTKFFILFLFTTCFFSCATHTKIQYVDRDVVRYESIEKHDTIETNTHDSVFYFIQIKGDTIREEKYVQKIEYRDVIVCKTDTVFLQKNTDKRQEVVTEKTKTPKWCYYCLAISIISFLIAIVKVFIWLH